MARNTLQSTFRYIIQQSPGQNRAIFLCSYKFFGNAVDWWDENLFLEYERDSGGGSKGRIAAIY